ncbi:MAG: peptidoglycan LD-endopeptidase LytH [Blastocatellia bacterium]|jgi:murein DD-endopeptidase MepM/ murein hydrolase activator NlpD|nr:peptidoglycan LD-endopeptidase LytH [Blastocatellia bacterium]
MQRPAALRRQIGVKKLVLASLPLVLLVLILTPAGMMWTGIKLKDKLVLYVRVARLSAQQPDLNLSMPVSGVTKNQITNTWHAARGERRHEGQDIFAPRGTPILSATEGYVVKIGPNNLGGQTVSVIGAGGRIYYYAHLDSYATNLFEGDYVTRQTVLGYVGTTGNADGTPPHLHFGVYARGGALNPLPLLSDRMGIRTDDRASQSQPTPRAKKKPVRERVFRLQT